MRWQVAGTDSRSTSAYVEAIEPNERTHRQSTASDHEEGEEKEVTDYQVQMTLLGVIGLLAGYGFVMTHFAMKHANDRDRFKDFYDRVVEARRGVQHFKYVRDTLDWILLKDYESYKGKSVIELRAEIQKGMVHDEEMRVEFDKKRIVRNDVGRGPGW